MDGLKKIQAVLVGFFAALTGWLGNLAIPVYVLLACNVIDYITALIAAPKRGQSIRRSCGSRTDNTSTALGTFHDLRDGRG